MTSPAGRLTACLMHVGRTSDWHGCETRVEGIPRRVRRVEGKAAGTPKEFRRVRGRGGPKSEVGAPSAQRARRETRLGRHRS